MKPGKYWNCFTDIVPSVASARATRPGLVTAGMKRNGALTEQSRFGEGAANRFLSRDQARATKAWN